MKNVSKSQFKAKALEYFRDVEASGDELIVTDNGTPVVKIIKYDREQEAQAARKRLAAMKVAWSDIDSPVGVEDWKALR